MGITWKKFAGAACALAMSVMLCACSLSLGDVKDVLKDIADEADVYGASSVSDKGHAAKEGAGSAGLGENGPADAESSGTEAENAGTANAEDTDAYIREKMDEAVKAARLYENIFTYTGKQVLSDETVMSYIRAAADGGYAVTDAKNTLTFENAEIVRSFFDTLGKTGEGELSFIEICYDGGLIKTDIVCNGQDRYVEHTRAAWRSWGVEATYYVRYPLSELYLSNDECMVFTSDISNNTGGNHDGYVDPTTVIDLDVGT